MTTFNINDDRHFKNEFVDYSSDNVDSNILSNNEVSAVFKRFLIKKLINLTNILNTELPNLSSKDISIYTGLGGIVYFYMKITNCNVVELKDISENCKKECDSLIRRCMRHLRNKSISIMTDDTGPLMLSVLLNLDKNNSHQIIKMCDYVVNAKDLPDEILYGRCGYLLALLILNKHKETVSIQLIKKVFQSIIQSGLKLSKLKLDDIPDIPPLFYEWHGKPYLGAAHGFAGIMYVLLQIYLDDSLKEIHSEIKRDIFEYVYPTIKFLCYLRLSSGNYPSSLGESSKRDILVHWCHGAPGWIHMFIAAHKIFKDQLFMDRIKEIGEVIWSRGLLYKGCGICHGTAGNGYALLAIYQYTRELKYLYRALKFAEWCTDYSNNRTREADRPYSLFEGLAGTLHFLVDCLDPINAKFPIYEV